MKVRVLSDDASEELHSKVVKLKSIRRDIAVNKSVNICICGDSKVQAGIPVMYADKLLKEDNNVDITWIGTRTNGCSGDVKHEGRGGWSYMDYINSDYENIDAGSPGNYSNAFMYNGRLDFKHYMEINFPNREIDIFIISLGTNDVSHGFNFTEDTIINDSVNAAKVFINALLSAETGFPNCKICVGLPDCGGVYSPHSGKSTNIFRNNINRLNSRLIETFDSGKYNENITTVFHGAFINRKEGYPHEEVSLNNDLYPDIKITQYSDNIHCNESGYKQLGIGYYNKIRRLINDMA